MSNEYIEPKTQIIKETPHFFAVALRRYEGDGTIPEPGEETRTQKQIIIDRIRQPLPSNFDEMLKAQFASDDEEQPETTTSEVLELIKEEETNPPPLKTNPISALVKDDLDELPPPRQWILGNSFCRRYISSLFSDGGIGKTTLMIAQTVAMATGKPITGEHVFKRSRVLYLSLEDDDEEMRRRLIACCLYHGIDRAELKGWFYRLCLMNGPKLAQLKNGELQAGELGKLIIEIIEDKQIDVVVFDPFIKSHSCAENDNNAIDYVCGILADLAITHNIAVAAPHHTSKGNFEPGNANSGRGASAAKDAFRLVNTLSRMDEDAAGKILPDPTERRSYVRVDSGKGNIIAPSRDARWFKLVSVALDNGTPDYPKGDSVQTVEVWEPVDVSGLQNDRKLLDHVCDAIRQAKPLAYTNSKHSPNRHILPVFREFNENISKDMATQIVVHWLDIGELTEAEIPDPKHKERPYKGLALPNDKVE
jgi:hypothetical protein